VGVAVAVTLFWTFRSRTLYGDARGTIHLLERGDWLNWKEPLDRALTQAVALLGRRLALFGPAEAMAIVSIAAGVIWYGAAATCARDRGRSPTEVSIAFGLLMTPGIMQLFFGNLENYSLLAAGVLVYLTLALRCLEGRCPYAWPCVALAITCVTHLSACWLLPGLAWVHAVRWRRGTVAFWSRDLWRGIAATVLPFVALLAVGGYHFGSLRGLSLATFGGADGSAWKPLYAAHGVYEKFALLSWSHAIALLNHLMLICAVAGGITLGSGVSLLAGARRLSAALGFVLLNLGLALAYVVLFNPDMAMYRVGLLNEWDLFSLPAVPAVVAAALLWTKTPDDSDRRDSFALLAIGTSALTTAVWILHNAGITR
jgi:hypothetical protein